MSTLQGIKAQGIKAQGIKAQGIKAQGIKAQGIKAQRARPGLALFGCRCYWASLSEPTYGRDPRPRVLSSLTVNPQEPAMAS